MNEIKCSGPGCTAVFQTTEPLSKNVTYTCREHTGKITDNEKPFFQSHAFDRSLGLGKKKDLDEYDRNDK